MNSNPLVSIIVPTHNSSYYLKTLLESIASQKYKNCEIIIADNNSKDSTLEIARQYKAKIIKCAGNPPQVAKQRNMGARVARGKYLYFVDHDMELGKNFIKHFERTVNSKKNKKINAWYVPETIISNSRLLSIARNFEAEFINGTVVSAARIMTKQTFLNLRGYDITLSGGPADWDLDIQLRLKNALFGTLNRSVYHHEEKLGLVTYIIKKTTYIKGEDIYKKKWINDVLVYKNIIEKQYSLKYRILWLFIENGQWKKLALNLHRYLVFLIVKISMSIFYDYRRRINV